MFQGLPRYPVYEPAGGWMDEIPAHWSWDPARTIFQERKETGFDDEPLLSVTIARGVISQAALLTSTSKKDSSNTDKSKYKHVLPGDLVYNKMRAWQGAAGLSRYRGIVSPAYIVMTPRRGEAVYFHHLVRTPMFAKEAERLSYGITSDQWSLRPEHFKMIRFPVPSAEEQSAIVKYLAHANARIDKAIAAKRRLVELLGQARRASIDGLLVGAQCNDTVRSSAPWLAEIPRGWTWRRCRTLISMITSGSRGWAEYYAESGPVFLQSGNLGRDLSLKLDNVQRVALPKSLEGTRTLVQPHDVLICITGALTGNVALVPAGWTDEAYVNQHVALARPLTSEVHGPFLAYALTARTSQIQLKGSECGGTKHRAVA
jgi:type I restriction enzyme S subunit